jgi:hypothetical protein
LRDPVRNRWLFDFGLTACVLVIPYALVFGSLRDIPFWWRLIDCSFGVFGFIPLWFCRKWTGELEQGVNRQGRNAAPSLSPHKILAVQTICSPYSRANGILSPELMLF